MLGDDIFYARCGLSDSYFPHFNTLRKHVFILVMQKDNSTFYSKIMFLLRIGFLIPFLDARRPINHGQRIQEFKNEMEKMLKQDKVSSQNLF